jgi:hypothetical protein
MSAIRGWYKDGQIVLDGPPPADWADGAEVRLELVDPVSEDDDPEGLLGSDPESIARWLAWYDSLQPFLSEEDEAKWRKALQDQKEWELANWEKHSKQIEDLFQ